MTSIPKSLSQIPLAGSRFQKTCHLCHAFESSLRKQFTGLFSPLEDDTFKWGLDGCRCFLLLDLSFVQTLRNHFLDGSSRKAPSERELGLCVHSNLPPPNRSVALFPNMSQACSGKATLIFRQSRNLATGKDIKFAVSARFLP